MLTNKHENNFINEPQLSFKRKKYEYYIQFAVAMLATCLGVCLAFCLENWKQNVDARDRFKAQVQSVENELGQDLESISRTNTNLTEIIEPIYRLSTVAQSYLLTNPDTYTFAGKDFIRAVTSSKTEIENYEKYSTELFILHALVHVLGKGFDKAAIEDYRKNATLAESKILLTLTQVRLFMAHDKIFRSHNNTIINILNISPATLLLDYIKNEFHANWR